MNYYNIITSTDELTVVSEYTPTYKTAADYQSEVDLEREFVEILTEQGYERLHITNEAALITNLRHQLEIINNFTFTDDEWGRFFSGCIANNAESIVAKTRKIQDDHVQVLRRDDGSTKNISPPQEEYPQQSFASDKSI